MSRRKSQRAELEKAARELEERSDDENGGFRELQELQDKLYGSAALTCGNVKWYLVASFFKRNFSHLLQVRTVIQKRIEGSSAAAAKAKNIGNTIFMPS